MQLAGRSVVGAVTRSTYTGHNDEMTTRRKRRERRGRIRAPQFPVEDRPHQYTFEGMIGLLGDFAAGANRAGGWKLLVARVLVALMLLPVILTGVKLFT